MVSADGPSVTPNEPDPQSETSSDPRAVSDAPATPRDRPTVPGNGNRPGEPPPADGAVPGEERTGEGEARPARGKSKPRKRSRRQRKIDRMVMEFQPDAVEMEHRKVAGGLRWTLYVVILMLGAAIAWATWAEVDRLVEAEGKLKAQEIIVIQPTTTSPIHAFNVKFGQRVKTGDVLVTLDPTFSDADVSKLEGQANSLDARIARLTAEQSGEDFNIQGHDGDVFWLTEYKLSLDRAGEKQAMIQKYEADQRKLNATRLKHEADVTELEGRLEKQEEKLATTRKLVERETAPRDQLLDEEIQVGYVRNLLINARNSIKETDADLDSLQKNHTAVLSSRKAEVSTELARVQQDYGALQDELTKARRANELVNIVVPEHPDFDEFIVLEVAERGVGSVVQPGDSLIRLIPADSPLEVECKVQSQDIARIREHEDGKPRDARIKLSAFPYMKHGTLEGHVRAISEDAFEEGQPPMVSTYYRVRVAITNDLLDEVPDNHRLLPGMAATVEIKVGRRRVIDYFLYPIFRSLDSSIREP